MFLSLTPYNFRNLANGPIDLSSREIYFLGENGQGKSNLLEAIYYSAYGSSFRTHIDNEVVRKGEGEMSLRTLFREESGTTHSTAITFQNKTKKIEKDGKIIRDRKELVNTMPCVLYSHEDMDFVIGSPERRRFFIDQSLSMYDILYIDLIRRYNRILKNRNQAIKDRQFYLLETYDFQLVQNGLEIQKKRKDAIFKFNQIFGRLYEEISGVDGVKVRYRPSWKKISGDDGECSFGDKNIPGMAEVIGHIKSTRPQEEIMNTTVSGPHRDRIIFERNGTNFIPSASTGQRRLIALILRNAQAVFYSEVTSRKPVLLMDDVLLELDPDKRRKINMLLPEYEQLFCTFLPGEPYENYMKATTRIYGIKDGTWSLQ